MNSDPDHRIPSLSFWRSLEVIGYVYSASVFGIALFLALQFHLGHLQFHTASPTPTKAVERSPASETETNADTDSAANTTANSTRTGLPVAGPANPVSENQAN